MRLIRALSVAVALAALALPALAQSSGFGLSVIVDGDELIVGEPNNSFRPGTVYIYRRAGDEWVESAQLRAPEGLAAGSKKSRRPSSMRAFCLVVSRGLVRSFACGSPASDMPESRTARDGSARRNAATSRRP